MFKSRDVAYINPSMSCNIVEILGIGYGVCIIHLFTSLKSKKTLTWPFFFGIMKVGAPHCEKGCLVKTPSLTNLVTSFLRVSKWMWGIRKALPWYGVVPGFNWNFMGSVFQSPSVPSNRSLNSSNSPSKQFCWDTVKC